MFGENAMEQQLMEARASLREARQNTAAAAGAERVGTLGEAADGLLRVAMDAEGRVESVYIDPTLMRGGSEYLAEQVRHAVNAALAGQASEDAGEPMPDLAAMEATIERLQDQSVRQMREISSAITDVMAKLRRD
ncbi:hypothetical protein Afil01_43410 [Actinorhabdospora filicis]|uniref:YbaB/EbfC DNA-binding family protein n=1 Tax=Actinorhabdospora filicis TaxID=1785913 RepID=A0A9W6WAD0_9ACTN|nr:YbaB/EbfC family nucleoid-associated protein [Actinorhabdospora filicis]GLZ79534.1 hypothetical protein Afil01_43410 [Actinorhabdospora filicis]